MFLVQVNDSKGVLKELTHVGTDRAAAEQKFISTCAENLSNWDEYDPGDIAAILSEGYETFGSGCVMLIDTDGFTSDDDIRKQLTVPLVRPKPIKGKPVPFKCTKCGHNDMEEILIGTVVTTPCTVFERDDGPPHFNLAYGISENADGYVDRYQCGNCGHVIIDHDNPLTDDRGMDADALAAALRYWM